MTITRCLAQCAVGLLFCLLAPRHAFADKFFEDNDAFFMKYLKQQKFAIDTSAPAVVLYERTSYDVLSGDLQVRRIVKILKKSGTPNADIIISVLKSRFDEIAVTVKRVHGTTYNLDGEKILKQDIDEDNIALETSGMLNEKKISMPAVHEGSVIDYRYEISNVGFSKWKVQESIPKLYSRLELSIPKEIDMATEDKVVPTFIEIDESKKNTPDSLLPYSYTYHGTDRKGQLQQCWVRQNIPSFDQEPYLPCESNLRESMVTYVRSARFINFEDLSPWAQALVTEYNMLYDKNVLNSWDKINEALVESYYFFRPVTAISILIKEKANELAGNDTSELSIAKKIFKFVRDSCTSRYSSLSCERDLSKVLNTRSGSSAGLNMLLTSLLRHAGLSCSPVILATKDNPTPSSTTPELIKYNYTICQLSIGGKKYYLDASEKYNPFGRLPPHCINGYARVIDKNKKDTCGVIFKPDMTKEKALYAVTTINDAASDYTLNYKFYFSDASSIEKREDWNKDTTEIKLYILSLIKDLPFDAKLRQYKILNLNDPEKQLTLDFNVTLAWPEAGPIYFNPYMVKLFEDNPFKSPTRKYPVELPATENLTYTMNLRLPGGYTVDEVPKAGIIEIDQANQFKNMVEYDKDANTLNIRSQLLMQRQYFPVSEYSMLREFFQKIGDEQEKTLVIKKL